PFYGWYYHWAWYPMLVALAAGYALAFGRPAGTPRLALSLLFWSAPLWFLFELINFRLANWYYVYASASGLARVAGAFGAFATVLPAIYLAYRWLERLGLARGWRGPKLPLHRHAGTLVAVGVGVLGLALWQPTLFFPFAWGFLTLVLEPWNYRRDPKQSLIGDLARGRYDRLIQLLAAGAVVGLLWEMFNSLAGARWVYTVPGLEGHKLFEMPLPGFLGFPIFALDCFVAYQALVNAGLAVPWSGPSADVPRRLPQAIVMAASAACVAFGVWVAVGMERWTIDSVYPRIEALPGVSTEEARAVRASGVQSVEGLAASRADLSSGGIGVGQADAIIEAASLASLKGMGAENATALVAVGIRTVCDLARADPDRVTAAVRMERDDPRAGRPARVRVWLQAASRECEE
ncbi:MAG: DUF4332 domain-containing protein, partial [Gemmatimonadetes bacterium]|nr:DUF4332 domain-containing protein [Gemmatimonadota bacterium]